MNMCAGQAAASSFRDAMTTTLTRAHTQHDAPRPALAPRPIRGRIWRTTYSKAGGRLRFGRRARRQTRRCRPSLARFWLSPRAPCTRSRFVLYRYLLAGQLWVGALDGRVRSRVRYGPNSSCYQHTRARAHWLAQAHTNTIGGLFLQNTETEGRLVTLTVIAPPVNAVPGVKCVHFPQQGDE